MSEKRRDNKGRILKTGESQRKDGRYLYKYVDSFGEPQFIYWWLQTEYQQESVIVFLFGKKLRSY